MQPKLRKPQEDTLDITEESLVSTQRSGPNTPTICAVSRQIFLVQQTIPVAEEQLDNYQTSLRHYTEKTATCPGCLL